MVSNSKQTGRIRSRRDKAQGNRRKRRMRVKGTPAFPIHPPGYDPKAADAKPTTASTPKASTQKSGTPKAGSAKATPTEKKD